MSRPWLALAALAMPVAGCFEQPAQLAAAAGYEAQQMRCIEQYSTREDIDRCRNKVKLAWTVDKLLDAGGDQ